jgi:hypothetical protein
MIMIRRFSAASAAALLVLLASPALRADESAAAVSLFDEGNRLYEAGDFAAACPKYEASLRLDATSIDTRGRLALCYEKTGRLASAWTSWREVKARASRSLGRERAVDIASSHISELEPHLARLTLHAAGGATVAGMSVTLDGVAFPIESLDVAVAVDKGNHRVEASAPGHRPWSGEVALSDGEKKSIDVGPLEELPPPPAPPAPTPGTGATAASPLVPAGPQPVRERPSSARKWIGIGVLGLGVVALGVGGFEALDAMSKHDDAVKLGCNDDLTGCPTAMNGIDPAQKAYDAANLATGFAIAGGALALTGIIVWATAPDGAPPERTAWHVTPTVGAGQAGVAFSGAF